MWALWQHEASAWGFAGGELWIQDLVIMKLDIVGGGSLCFWSRCRVKLGLQVIQTNALEKHKPVCSQTWASSTISCFHHTFFSAMSSKAFSNSVKVIFCEPFVFDYIQAAKPWFTTLSQSSSSKSDSFVPWRTSSLHQSQWTSCQPDHSLNTIFWTWSLPTLVGPECE